MALMTVAPLQNGPAGADRADQQHQQPIGPETIATQRQGQPDQGEQDGGNERAFERITDVGHDSAGVRLTAGAECSEPG